MLSLHSSIHLWSKARPKILMADQTPSHRQRNQTHQKETAMAPVCRHGCRATSIDPVGVIGSRNGTTKSYVTTFSIAYNDSDARVTRRSVAQ